MKTLIEVDHDARTISVNGSIVQTDGPDRTSNSDRAQAADRGRSGLRITDLDPDIVGKKMRYYTDAFGPDAVECFRIHVPEDSRPGRKMNFSIGEISGYPTTAREWSASVEPGDFDGALAGGRAGETAPFVSSLIGVPNPGGYSFVCNPGDVVCINYRNRSSEGGDSTNGRICECLLDFFLEPQ